MSSERGSAMVTSLLAVAVLSILAATTYRLTRTLVRETTWQMRSAQAQAVGEAGLEDALRQLYENPSWRTGFTDKPFAGGRYTVTLSTDTEPLVRSTGYSMGIFLFGSAVRSVSARARLTYSGGAAVAGGGSGFAVVTDYFKSQGAVVDSFVPPGPPGSEGGIWSNGRADIQCSSNPCVKGSIWYTDAPAPSPASASGAVAHATYTLTLPNHTCPSCAAGNDNRTGISPSSVYSSSSKDLFVDNGKTASLAPGVYYFRHITVKGTLNISTPATIYFTGKLTTDSSCAINNLSQTPSLVAFYGQGSSSSHSIKCDSPLHAYLEDRTGDFTLDMEVFGRIWGDKVEFKDGTLFHADIAPAGPQAVAGVSWEPGAWGSGYGRP
ncbi:MAG: hypothetical protein HY928_16500 [Elusimicrobia bacterium]|nr:hypothetical protein [Elusimicrobiota bacterium]